MPLKIETPIFLLGCSLNMFSIFYYRLGFHQYDWQQCHKKIANTKYSVKHKLDAVTTTGSGADQTQMNSDEQVVARVLGEGAVLQVIEGGLDSKDMDQQDSDQNVPSSAIAEPCPSTSSATEEPVSITVNWDSEKIKELLEAVPSCMISICVRTVSLQIDT